MVGFFYILLIRWPISIAEGTFTEDVTDAIYNAVVLPLNTNYSVYLNDVEIAIFRTIS